MEQQAILALGTLTLVACGAGLVSIHSNSPLLKGLNWMGCALLAGGAAAGLTLASLHWAYFLPLANFCIVLAFALCFRADQFLLDHDEQRSSLSGVLLVIEALLAPLQWLHLLGPCLPTVILSLLLAVQLEATARLILRTATTGTRGSARFTAALMRLLVAANLLRGALAAIGVLQRPIWGYRLETAADGIFVAAAICLGFCFFWRATAKLTEEFEHMASTDPLTRVFNRRVFLKWCDKELLRSQGSGFPVSVLLIDFDHFKRINDTYGHHVGDEVLCASVERIQDSIRGIDVLCRWGGEEFAVLLPNASPAATLMVAERVRQNVRAIHPLSLDLSRRLKADLHLSVSIGTANYERGDDSVEAMLQRADAALYQAKHAGRDRVVASPARGSGDLSNPQDSSYLWVCPTPAIAASTAED